MTRTLRKLVFCVVCYGNPKDPSRDEKEIAGLNGQYWPTIMNMLRALLGSGREVELHLMGGQQSGTGALEADATAEWLEELDFVFPNLKVVPITDVFGGAGIAIHVASQMNGPDTRVLLACDTTRQEKMARLLCVGYTGDQGNWEQLRKDHLVAVPRNDVHWHSQPDAIEAEREHIELMITTRDALIKMAEEEARKAAA